MVVAALLRNEPCASADAHFTRFMRGVNTPLVGELVRQLPSCEMYARLEIVAPIVAADGDESGRPRHPSPSFTLTRACHLASKEHPWFLCKPLNNTTPTPQHPTPHWCCGGVGIIGGSNELNHKTKQGAIPKIMKML